MTKFSDYHPGHPWYYRLGGRLLFPSEILIEINKEGYEGYNKAYIIRIDEKAEPERSEELRALKTQFRDILFEDISKYRAYGRLVKTLRRENRDKEEFSITNCPYIALSLKHSHIYNNLAYLQFVNKLLLKQPDLFD